MSYGVETKFMFAGSVCFGSLKKKNFDWLPQRLVIVASLQED